MTTYLIRNVIWHKNGNEKLFRFRPSKVLALIFLFYDLRTTKRTLHKPKVRSGKIKYSYWKLIFALRTKGSVFKYKYIQGIHAYVYEYHDSDKNPPKYVDSVFV